MKEKYTNYNPLSEEKRTKIVKSRPIHTIKLLAFLPIKGRFRTNKEGEGDQALRILMYIYLF